MGGISHTEDELLGGRQHVYGEGHLVLVYLEANPADDGGEDEERHGGGGKKV